MVEANVGFWVNVAGGCFMRIAAAPASEIFCFAEVVKSIVFSGALRYGSQGLRWGSFCNKGQVIVGGGGGDI